MVNDKRKREFNSVDRKFAFLLYLLVPTMLYVSLAVYLYNIEKSSIVGEANRYFIKEAPFWADSIYCFSDINMVIDELYTNGYIVERCQKYRVVDDYHGNCTVPGKWIHEKNYYLHFNRLNNLRLFSSGHYDIAIADSLWNAQLWRNGIKVNTSLIMTRRELRDVFPSRDSFNPNAPAVSDTSRVIDFEDAYVTDTAHLSFRNMFDIVGLVDVPFALVVERIWPVLLMFTILFVIYLLFLLLKGVVWMYRGSSDNTILFIGNAFVIGDRRVVVFADGAEKRISANELLGLQMLAKNNGRRIAIKEITDVCWKGYVEESARKNFNQLFASMSKTLASVAHVTLKREKNEVLYLENTNFINRIVREVRLVVYLIKN